MIGDVESERELTYLIQLRNLTQARKSQLSEC